jgi:hypothetical protein
VAKDYADDDEGFPERFKLSLQSAEDASGFQRHVTPSHHEKATTAFGMLPPSTTTTQRDSVSVDDNAATRNPVQAAFPQRPVGQAPSAQGSINPFGTSSASSPPPPTSNPFTSYTQRVAATGGVVGARVSPPLESEFGATARKALQTVPRRTLGAPQVMRERYWTTSIATRPSQRCIAGARVMSHQSRWRVAPRHNASLKMAGPRKLRSSRSRATTRELKRSGASTLNGMRHAVAAVPGAGS